MKSKVEDNRVIYHKGNIMSYPVGLNLMSNIEIIKLMSKKLDTLYSGQEIIFWTRGSSGAIIASVAATFLKHNECYINHVKKEGETSHSTNQLRIDSKSINIIIDDFICTGETIRKMIDVFNSCYDVDKEIDCLCISGTLDKNLDFLNKFNKIVCS